MNRSDLLRGLSIRRTLFFSFGAIAAVMMLSIGVTMVTTGKLSNAIGGILENRLPSTIETLRIARSAEALASAGSSLPHVMTQAELISTQDRISQARKNLDASLDAIGAEQGDYVAIQDLTETLKSNLVQLVTVAHGRIALGQRLQGVKQQLNDNMLSLRHPLTYRLEVLQGDSDVMRHLLQQSSPSPQSIVNFARGVAPDIPVAQFYARLEMVFGQLLVATQDATLSNLGLSYAYVTEGFVAADVTYSKMSKAFAKGIQSDYERLRDIALGGEGILALRKQELTLQEDSKKLVRNNQLITTQLESVTRQMVQQGLTSIDSAGRDASAVQQRYVMYSTIFAVAGLLGIASLLYIFVMRKIIARLSGMSRALRKVAAGELDTELPDVGPDEIGQLGAAVHHFRDMAVASEDREAKLRQKNHELEEAQDNLEEAERQKNLFLARISHDLRSPLYAILNSGAELNLAQHPSGKLSKLMGNSQAVLKLLDDLIDFSRLEQGSLRIFPAPFFLHHLISGLITHGEECGQKCGLTFTADLGDNLPVAVLSDEDRIRQILRNLIENAFKHGKTNVCLTVDAEENEAAARIRFSVSDTGQGIPPEQQKLLLQPFYQGNADSASGGSGLGLSIVAELCDVLGGELEITDTPGGGVTFTVVLPMDVVAEERVDIGDAFTVPKILSQDDHILIADDNPEHLGYLEDLLLMAGGDVVAASSIAEAMEMAENMAVEGTPAHVLITDQFMGDGTGGELLEKLRATEAYAELPAIMVTAAYLNVSTQSKDAFADILSKPVNPQHLLATLRMALHAELNG